MFGRRRASKCKKLLKQAQFRLKQVMARRSSMAKHLRSDMGKLITLGHEETALIWAEQLYKEESILGAYELMERFCEIVAFNLPCIRANKEFPDDVNEASSSLIFASMRCGDVPELRSIRHLFGEVCGQRFVETAIELLPGNVVHHHVQEKLTIRAVADSLKRALVDEARKESSNTLVIDQISDEDAHVQNSNLEDSLSEEENNAEANEGLMQLRSPVTTTGFASSSDSDDDSVRVREQDIDYLGDIEETEKSEEGRDESASTSGSGMSHKSGKKSCKRLIKRSHSTESKSLEYIDYETSDSPSSGSKLDRRTKMRQRNVSGSPSSRSNLQLSFEEIREAIRTLKESRGSHGNAVR